MTLAQGLENEYHHDFLIKLYIDMSSRMPNGKPVALVIGASRGMGRQIAISLAGEGYTGKASIGGL